MKKKKKATPRRHVLSLTLHQRRHPLKMAHHIPIMNWCDPDLSEAMSLFKQKMTLFIEDEEITEEAKQARKICRGIGDAGLRRLNASGLTEEQKKSPIHLWNFFENQLRVNVNFRIHRLHLMQYRQKINESLDDYHQSQDTRTKMRLYRRGAERKAHRTYHCLHTSQRIP